MTTSRRSALGCLLLLLVALNLLAVYPVATQDRPGTPLPDREAFLREVKKKLRREDRDIYPYIYNEREVQVEFDGDGKATKRTVKTYEVYPLEGHEPYRRLISTNGVPTDPRKLEDADRKHQQKVQEWVRDRKNESASDRAKREQKEARARQEEARSIEEVFRVFDVRLVGREFVRGRPAIATTFAPRPGVEPVDNDLDILTKVRGRALVDEQEHELVRVDAETTDTITWGFGLLARLYKGSTLSFERQKVNGEAWLPVRLFVHPRARLALLRRYDTETTRDYSDYRKFTVDTATSFTLPKPPGR
ncbi:MAG: hypothetical protein ACM3NQ_09390 [Bacteroidales bacterium]